MIAGETYFTFELKTTMLCGKKKFHHKNLVKSRKLTEKKPPKHKYCAFFQKLERQKLKVNAPVIFRYLALIVNHSITLKIFSRFLKNVFFCEKFHCLLIIWKFNQAINNQLLNSNA